MARQLRPCVLPSLALSAQRIRRICLAGTSLVDADAVALCRALVHGVAPRLKALELGDNPALTCGCAGAIGLAARRLQLLSLSGCSFLDGPGLAALAEAVCGDGDPSSVTSAQGREPRLPPEVPVLVDGLLKECGLNPRGNRIIGEDNASKEVKQRRMRATQAAKRRGGVDKRDEAMRLLRRAAPASSAAIPPGEPTATVSSSFFAAAAGVRSPRMRMAKFKPPRKPKKRGFQPRGPQVKP